MLLLTKFLNDGSYRSIFSRHTLESGAAGGGVGNGEVVELVKCLLHKCRNISCVSIYVTSRVYSHRTFKLLYVLPARCAGAMMIQNF